MARRTLLFVAALAATFAFGTAAASADEIGLTLPPDIAEPAVDLATLVSYPAEPLGLGETIAEPAAVTDAELSSVGASSLEVTLTSSAPDFVVDDDLAQCPDADFTTAAGIQLAVAAAPLASTIRVCPGVYTPVNVPKTLTLEAPVQHGQATQCQAALPPDPTKDAIVDAGNTPAIGFTLAADGIELLGFTVQNTQGNPGIYALPTFSGYKLRFNVVQNNTFGLYLNASGAQETVVDHNCFRFNNRPGSASGDGIYSDQGLRNALVQENTFVGNNSASMVYALNQQDIAVSHNDGDNSFVFVDTQNALVEYNHLDMAVRQSGLLFAGGVTATARYNLIEDPSTGIQSVVAFVPVPNQVVIEKNHVRGGTFDGIRLNGTSNSVVAGNKSERNVRDGIRLQNGSNLNQVRDNLSRDNGRDGMRVDGGVQSTGNTIEQNKMLGNVEHDCHDDTVGGGSGGTANFWIKNVGKTQNRPGLCKNATVQ